MPEMNAGLRLWEVQKLQGTGLCVGADPHLDPQSGLGEEFYTRFADEFLKREFEGILRACDRISLHMIPGIHSVPDPERAAIFASGVAGYFIRVLHAAWKCGIRLKKPQSAFFERFDPLGPIIKSIICRAIDDLAIAFECLAFKILDAKRGDLSLTQEPYFAVNLTDIKENIFPGVNGQYDFDTMTITTWMGEDVIVPGLEHFRKGNGAIVVTRSSNPSGTTLQDVYVLPNSDVVLSPKQEPYRLTKERYQEICVLIGRRPMAHS